MDECDMIQCVHCTLLNPPGRTRCSICQRNILKRPRSSLLKGPSQNPKTEKNDGSCEMSLQLSSGQLEYSTDNKQRVLTFFATASGKPVSVSEASLAAAKERLGASEFTETRGNATTAQSAVPTLFSTAAGKPVSVSDASLAAAKERLGASEFTETRGNATMAQSAVPTLFSTAAGKPVSVSEASLAAAKERLGASSYRSKSPSSSSNGECPAAAAGKSASPSNESISMAAAPVQTSPSSSVFIPRRRAFVSPRVSKELQRVPQPVEAVPTAKLLSFDIFTFSALAVSSSPSYEDVLSGVFAFKRASCSGSLLQLLGLAVDEDTLHHVHFRHALLTLGANPNGCSVDWCNQMLRSSLLKLHGLSARATPALPVLSAAHALIYMCFKYNREFVLGERPALRVVTEGDVAAASMMVLNVVSIALEERTAPHTCVAYLSDGSYEVRTTLDVPLTNLAREGILCAGKKLLVCGAKMLKRTFASPLECHDDVVLALQFNCTRPLAATAPLGFHRSTPPIVPANAIHPLGGLVPSVRGYLQRLLPPFFVEQPLDKSYSDGTRIVRSMCAQLKCTESLAPESTEKPACRLARVVSMVLSCEQPEDIIVQLWQDCEGISLEEVSDEGLPPEGATVVLFALTPSRGRPPQPFTASKSLYTRGRLDYVQLSPPTGRSLPITNLLDGMCTLPTPGSLLDVAGFFLETCQLDKGEGIVVVIATLGVGYCLMDIPSATPLRDVSISLPASSFTPVIVQNATFLRRADDDFGSDCVRLVSNEFTRVVQRPSATSLREVVALFEREKEKFMRCKTVDVRVKELLRLRQMGNTPRTNEAHSTMDTSVAASRSPARVPYYLRGEPHKTIPRGVILREPKGQNAALQQEIEPRRSISSAFMHHSEENKHVFGNIAALRMRRRLSSGDFETVKLFSSSPDDDDDGDDSKDLGKGENICASIPNSTHQDTCTVFFEVDIQYGALVRDTMKGRIVSPVILTGLLEQRIAMRSVSTLVVDDGCVEHFISRTRHFEAWKEAPQESWWRLFFLSHVLSGDDDEYNTEDTVTWLESEWQMLLQMIVDGLRDCLFKFTVHQSGNVTRVLFIREECSLCDVMSA